jgi:hypothetical protein
MNAIVFEARTGEDHLLRLPGELPAGLRVRVTMEPLPETEPGPAPLRGISGDAAGLARGSPTAGLRSRQKITGRFRSAKPQAKCSTGPSKVNSY